MKITSSLLADCLFRKQMIHDAEELWAMALGPGLQLLSIQMIFRGTVDACTIHPRDIFRFACLNNASQIIIAHNHPSGEVQPSGPDLQLTRRLVFLGMQMEIPLVDHLVLTTQDYCSLAESHPSIFNQSASSAHNFKTKTPNLFRKQRGY